MNKPLKQEQVNFTQRNAEKKACREYDFNKVSNGASAKLLREKNFLFSGINMSKVVIVTPNGHKLIHPSLKR